MRRSLAALILSLSVSCQPYSPPVVEAGVPSIEQTPPEQDHSPAEQLDNPALPDNERVEVEFHGRTFSYPQGEYRPMLRPYFALIAQVKNYTESYGMAVSNNYLMFDIFSLARRGICL